MLTKWVVSSYELLIEIVLWIFLIIGGLAGFGIGSNMKYPIAGAVIGIVLAFCLMAVFLGAALVLVQIHKRIIDVEKQMKVKLWLDESMSKPRD